MSDSNQIRQALATFRKHADGFDREVLQTIYAVLENQLATSGDEPEEPAAPGLGTQSDRRPVTVLFAELSQPAAASAESLDPARRRALWRRLDQIITAHGGLVDKHMGDVVMAVFGVPMAADNDAERAVRAALAMSQLVDVSHTMNVETPPLTMRVGINTGLVSVGPVGSDGQATVIGDTVNVASRLRESAVPGSVVIGENTYRLVAPFYETDALGQLLVKGRQTTVHAFRVVAARPRLFFTSGRGIEGVTTPMIGREAELARLQSAVITAADEGRGELVLVTGEAGVGKTRLAGELNAWLQTSGPEAVVFQGRSDQRLQRMPFGLLRDLLTSYFGILDSDAPDVVEARLLETLQAMRRTRNAPANWPRLFRERVRAVARLVGLDLAPGSEIATEPPSRSAVEQARDDILEYFELVAANTDVAVVFLEDIHWADADSLDLIEKLGRLAERTSLVVVALARPQLFERRPHWLPDGRLARNRLPLRPLLPDESYRLAGAILRYLPDAPDDLVALIVQAAGGNPFYMEELVKVLLGDGVILKDGARWRLSVTQLDRLRMPDTLTGILQARIDRLPSIERLTLQQAAIVGNEFWDGSVQQINEAARDPASPDEVTRALHDLEAREMIYRAPLSAFAGVQAYQFRHSMLREVAYETILLKDRPYYHSAAAEWLEAQSSDRVADFAAPIAMHYELAGDREKAAALYEVAGRRSLSLQRPGRAAEYFGRALTLLQQFPHHTDRRLVLLRMLGPALLAKGKSSEALAAFLTMEQTADEAGDLLEQARAALAQVGIYQERGMWAEMLAASERAAQTAGLTGANAEVEQAQAARMAALRALGEGGRDADVGGAAGAE